MKIGIAVFAYCRNKHLEQVLNGLKANTGIDKLYVFQDGLKTEDHRIGWLETTKLIEEIDWCEVKYIKAHKNQGLRISIIKGIDYVLSENDAIVVVEDDCVPTPGFMTYMRVCLEKYESNKNVWHVGGYGRAFLNEKRDTDVYFSNKMDCWGWGTWKDRWNRCDFTKDYLLILQTDRELSLKTNLWCSLGVEDILYEVEKGNVDTWDLWWALCIIENDGLCVSPYKSYIRNIGFDGSGTHCPGGVSKYESMIQTEQNENVSFQQEERIEEFVRKAFSESDWGSALAYHRLFSDEKQKNKAVIYGVGNGLREYEKQISKLYDVIGLVDRARKGYYAGIEIEKPDRLMDYMLDKNVKILITLMDYEKAYEIKKYIIKEYNIDAEQIVVLSSCEG